MTVAAILFDLDETLITDEAATEKALQQTAKYGQKQCDINAERLWRSAYAYAKRMWRASPAFSFCESLGISASEGMWGRFEQSGQQWELLYDWVAGYRVAVWEHALAAQGCAKKELAEELATTFREKRRNSQELFPETVRVLSQLHMSYKLGILTNGASDLQREKIEYNRLGQYFDAIVASGDVGVGKPDAAVFNAVLKQLAVPAHATLMVGDSLERDMLGASQNGLRGGIWVNRDGQSSQPYTSLLYAEIATLDEIYKVL